MSFLRDLAQGQTTFDFVGKRILWFRISAVLVVISLGFLIFRGLNLGIAFRGGTTINTNNPAGATVPDLRELTDAAGVDGAVIQLVDGGESVRVQTPALDPDIESELIDAVATTTGTERTDISIDSIGPSFGALILRQSMVALVVFLIAVALFMSWRLEWKMAGAGLAALVHDLIITVGVYSITWFEVTPATVVALLTILGYSLYDTVVVFDKVTELVADLGERMNYSDIVNRAMNMVLGRSLNTSLTSLLPVGSVLFVGSFLFGATALRDFALALFVGLAASTYSSIFVAAPILAVWKEGDEEWTSRRRRLAAKSAAAESVRTGVRTTSRPNRPRPPKGRR
ncbi:MAG: protein translocase subunit SecF [Acidimicrobiia bacterium]